MKKGIKEKFTKHLQSTVIDIFKTKFSTVKYYSLNPKPFQIDPNQKI